MKKIFLLGIIILMSCLSSEAQYKTAFGIRYNGGLGLDAKFNLNNQNALEAILTGYGNGLNLALLFEKHQTAFSSNQWRWYVGAGGHMGYWANLSKRKWNPYRYETGINVGLDAILGIEHTFDEIPLNISLDWKPALNLIPNPDLGIRNIGITGRFVIR